MIANITSADATGGVTLVAGASGQSIVVDTLVVSSAVSTLFTLLDGATTLFQGYVGANAGPFILPEPIRHAASLRCAAGNTLSIDAGAAGNIAVHATYHFEEGTFTETPGTGATMTPNLNVDIVELTWVTSTHPDDLPTIFVKKDAGAYVWAATLAQDEDQLNYDTGDAANPYTGAGDYSFKLQWVRGGIAGAFGAVAGPTTVP